MWPVPIPSFCPHKVNAFKREVATVEITEIRLTMRNEDKLKAFANVTFDNAFVIRGMKIIGGNKGLFISMPSKKRPNGTYQDIAHPINNSTRDWMEEQIVQAFEREVDKVQTETGVEVAEP